MPDRATLAHFGKLVAADVTAGRPGANSWAASQALEAHPEAVLDLIEMLFTEGRKTRPNGKLVSAYVYMIGQALEVIRMALENGQASAQELADAVRLTLLQAGTSGLVQPVLLVMILRPCCMDTAIRQQFQYLRRFHQFRQHQHFQW